jgi:Fibronectin type III domain
MRPVHRKVFWAGIVVGLVIALVPSTALAVFSAAPAVTAGVTAATISAPGGFTATAASTTTVNLSWTAPPTLTGYTLSQSPGTLAGCSATPSGTSCTATGLTSKTAYTWTLKAAYNNWLSSPVQASATTMSAVGFTLVGKATDGTGGTSSSTATGVTTISGAGLLILIFRQGSSAVGITSVSGSAISGTGTAITSQAPADSNFEVAAYYATGTGKSNGTVTVSFSASNNVSTTIDVVQLSGDNTVSPIAQSAVSASSSSGATVTGGALSGASANDGELFFAVLTTATSMSTPTGYTVLDVPASTVHGVWDSSSASAAGITTNLGVSSYWGTIEIEISHG